MATVYLNCMLQSQLDPIELTQLQNCLFPDKILRIANHRWTKTISACKNRSPEMAQEPHEKTIFAHDLLRDPSTIIRALLQSEPLIEQCEESGPHAFLHRPHTTFLSLHIFLVLLLSVHMHLFFSLLLSLFFAGKGKIYYSKLASSQTSYEIKLQLSPIQKP